VNKRESAPGVMEERFPFALAPAREMHVAMRSENSNRKSDINPEAVLDSKASELSQEGLCQANGGVDLSAWTRMQEEMA
jgi:hypothetical protein